MNVSVILRAVASSWLLVLANAVVGFLLTPYVLHHLGDMQFGLYVLVTTLTGYYGLFDLGVRSAVLRFVSRGLALNDHDEINRVICSAFYYYWIICVLAILATVLMLPWVPKIFGISGETASAFQSLFLLAGIVQGLIFPLNVFAGSLDASGRFDQVYMVQTLSLLLRVGVVILAIRAGGRLFAVGAVVLLSVFLSYVLQVPLALRQIHGVSLSPKWVSKDKLREMFRYSSVTIGVGMGDKLKAYGYPVLVALFMNPVAVTMFSLPARLLRFPTDGVSTMTEIVNPASSHLDARQDYAKLRQLIQLSAQSAFLLLVPMAVFLVISGRDVLRLWVGSAYLSSYPVLVLLTLGIGCEATQACIQSMLFGIGQHRGLIAYRLGEAGMVLLFGSAMLKFFGLEAYALVIALTLVTTSLFLIPRHLCRILGLSLRVYLKEACLKPCLLTIPFAAALFGLHLWITVKSWFGMLGLLASSGLVYLATLLWAMLRPEKEAWNQWTSLGVLEVLEGRVYPVLSKARASGSSRIRIFLER